MFLPKEAIREKRSQRAFVAYSRVVLASNLMVILWGAFVRATGSGAGCGEHWPLCNGTAVPHSPQIATIIEFLHRVTSGFVTVLVVGLVAAAFLIFPARHLARRMAAAAFILTLVEGAIGAAIVLLGHVAHDTSMARAYTFSGHLVNTFMLLAALALTTWAGSRREVEWCWADGRFKIALGVALAAVLILAVSGGIAALGDTLFASSSLKEGLRQDFSPSAHPFIRLRIWHPMIAACVSLYLAGLVFTALKRARTPRAVQAAQALIGLVILQLGAGMINLVLMAPVALQLIHLLLADLVWLALVFLNAEFVFVVGPAVRPAPVQGSVFARNT